MRFLARRLFAETPPQGRKVPRCEAVCSREGGVTRVGIRIHGRGRPAHPAPLPPLGPRLRPWPPLLAPLTNPPPLRPAFGPLPPGAEYSSSSDFHLALATTRERCLYTASSAVMKPSLLRSQSPKSSMSLPARYHSE